MPKTTVFYTKACEYCNTSFVTGKSYKRFCNKVCTRAAWKPKKREANKIYSDKVKDKKKEYDRLYHIANAEKKKLIAKQHREANKHLRYAKEKAILEDNPQKYLYKRIQTLLKVYLKKNRVTHGKSRTLEMLGFTIKELEQHLKSTLKEGMTWEAFLKGEIHIDHKKPHSLFTYTSTDDEDFKKCWSLNNLQLLHKTDNLKKQNKYVAD